MMATYYRASDCATIGGECCRHCVAESREHAEAYLGDGGLGGGALWAIDFDFAENELLDLGDSIPEAMERLHAALASIGVDIEAIDWAAHNWPYEILFSCHAYWEELRAAGYRAVRYPDEYPAGCITTAYLGDEVEMRRV